jgi:uncharacterized protein YfiM (DUF2279 family)
MIAALALAAAVAADSGDSWIGRDKVKHFLVSAFVHGVAFSAARTISGRRPAQVAGAAAVVTTGLLKEMSDRRAGRSFSVRDLAWNAAGGAASASLLNGAR